MVGAGTGGGCSGGALADYTSDLWFEATFRVTDKNNAAGTTPGTASDPGFPAPLLQPVFKCWAGRCQTCRQPVDLDHLSLHRHWQDE